MQTIAELLKVTADQRISLAKTTVAHFENARKTIAKTITAMIKAGDSPIAGIVKYCRDKCDIDIRKGRGIQGALELMRVLNAIYDKTIEASEIEFDAIPWTASQDLSPYLDPESTTYKYKDQAVAAWKSPLPSKAFKELKEKIKAEIIAANQPAIAAVPDAPAAPASNPPASINIAIENAPTPPVATPATTTSDAIAAIAQFINDTTDTEAIQQLGEQLATILGVAAQRIDAINKANQTTSAAA